MSKSESNPAPETPQTPVVEMVVPQSSGTSDLARGVEAARLLEETTERVRRARRHAKRGKKGDTRRAARDQLKRLRHTLEARQEQVLSKGIGEDDHHELAALLHALDRALVEFLDGKPRKKALERIRQAAKTTRKTV